MNQQEISDKAVAYCEAKNYLRGPTHKVAYQAFVAGAQMAMAERDALRATLAELEAELARVRDQMN